MTLAYQISIRDSAALSINFSAINWLAVLVAGFAAFMLGGVWYQVLFSKPWIKAQGWSPERIEALKKQMNPAKFFGGMIISYLILATIIAIIVTTFDTRGAAIGAEIGALMWIATACVTMTHQLASGRHINAWFIDAGCELVYLLMMGAIIGAWR